MNLSDATKQTTQSHAGSPATLDDLPELAELLGVLFAQEDEFQADAELQSVGLRRILANPEAGRVLVWREKGHVVGMANVLFTVSTALGKRVAILDDFVVHPNSRGKGIGSQLLDAAIDLCKASGCARVSLHTDNSNIDAQRLYERHGFRASTMLAMNLHL